LKAGCFSGRRYFFSPLGIGLSFLVGAQYFRAFAALRCDCVNELLFSPFFVLFLQPPRPPVTFPRFFTFAIPGRRPNSPPFRFRDQTGFPLARRLLCYFVQFLFFDRYLFYTLLYRMFSRFPFFSSSLTCFFSTCVYWFPLPQQGYS